MPCAIVDERISKKCERGLERLGFKVIKVPPARSLPEPVASHTDMVMFAHKNRIITSADYCECGAWVFSDIREYSRDTEILFTADSYGNEYPTDAIFNALVVGKYAFIKPDTVSEAIKEYICSAGLEPVSVRQGYPACTVLAFGNSAITADEGMASALLSKGIRVTLIRNGDISLPPYEYGFIGGASGVFSDKVYFLGDLNTHRDHEIIEKAIRDEGYTPISLSDEGLFDLGRIIFTE